jgi:NodT family efflux transporter outer membrane factor (OMF) lipoprotein
MRLLILLLLLAGCRTLAPEPPAGPTLPTAFRFETGGLATSDQWWRDLQSPVLDSLMDEALRSAPDIRTARARLDQAQAAAAKTGAALWPQLDAGADAARSWTKTKARNVVEADAYGLGLAASYELDLWGRVRSLRQADLLAARASAEDLRTAVLSLSGEIAQAWISLCSARQQLTILRQQQRTNADILSTLERRFSNSLASALDVLQQREAMAENEARIVPLEAETVRLENRLHLLLGKAPGSVDLSSAAALPDAMPLPAAGIPADLLRERPDIRAGWHRLLESGWNVAAAEADRLPALRLTGRFEQDGPDIERIFDNWLANLAASLTAPILDGGARKAEVQRQTAVREERLAAYEKTVFTALSEVDTAVSDVARQFELLRALAAQRELSRAALASARIRYQNGVIAYDTVLSLLLKLQQLDRSLTQEQASLLILQTGLCRSLGKGWRTAFPDSAPTLTTEGS